MNDNIVWRLYKKEKGSHSTLETRRHRFHSVPKFNCHLLVLLKWIIELIQWMTMLFGNCIRHVMLKSSWNTQIRRVTSGSDYPSGKPPVFSWVRVTRPLVLCVCISLFVLFYFDHCVVCSSSINRFWLPPFGIFKLILDIYVFIVLILINIFIFNEWQSYLVIVQDMLC
jgi:hypothetical protein